MGQSPGMLIRGGMDALTGRGPISMLGHAPGGGLAGACMEDSSWMQGMEMNHMERGL